MVVMRAESCEGLIDVRAMTKDHARRNSSEQTRDSDESKAYFPAVAHGFSDSRERLKDEGGGIL